MVQTYQKKPYNCTGFNGWNVDSYSCNFLLPLHKINTMRYYRITIELLDKKPVQGIRHYDNPNIDAVTNIARVKANRYYGERNMLDVEAAMLSNHCKAVKKFQADQQKRKDKKAFNSLIENSSVPPLSRRKIYIKSAINLEERNK